MQIVVLLSMCTYLQQSSSPAPMSEEFVPVLEQEMLEAKTVDHAVPVPKQQPLETDTIDLTDDTGPVLMVLLSWIVFPLYIHGNIELIFNEFCKCHEGHHVRSKYGVEKFSKSPHIHSLHSITCM